VVEYFVLEEFSTEMGVMTQDVHCSATGFRHHNVCYGKPDYQASEMVIGEAGRVMGIKNDT